MKTAKPSGGTSWATRSAATVSRPPSRYPIITNQTEPNMTKPLTKKISATVAAVPQPETPIWSQVEQLSLKLALLEAMLFNTSGAASEGFNEMDEEQRDVYLNHCAGIASAARVEAICIMEAARDAARTAPATA
jgi:hypothetical protein